jgi:hypothetical protein
LQFKNCSLLNLLCAVYSPLFDLWLLDLSFPKAARSILRSVAHFLAMDSAGQGHISRLSLSIIFPPGARRRSLVFLFVRSPGLSDFGSWLGSSLHLVCHVRVSLSDFVTARSGRSLELSVDFLLA